MKSPAVIIASAMLLSGCMSTIDQFVAQPPHLTPVGSGLADIPPMQHVPEVMQANATGSGYSVWQDSAGELFSIPRAMRPGDVLTVHIEINDRASLDNSIDRSRDANANFGLGFDYDFTSSEEPDPFSIELDGTGKVNSGTSTKGKGSIARSENIRLAVAAVVTHVFPNGNLMIKGSQEIRVNHEVRVLQIAGIARPEDVTGGNTISYDKIAEARVSYGGRGRLDEVQRPGWGQRLYDVLAPF